MSPWIRARQLQGLTPQGAAITAPMSFEIGENEIFHLLGDNGSGKSTLVRCVLGLHRFFRGEVELQIPRERVAYLPQLQNPSFHIPITLQDVIRTLCETRVPVSEILAQGLLESRHLSRAWNSASGGEKQRTLLTVLLLKDPRLLILDEPFNHLDQETANRIHARIEAFARPSSGDEPGRSVILVSHRVAEFYTGAKLTQLDLSNAEAPCPPL